MTYHTGFFISWSKWRERSRCYGSWICLCACICRINALYPCVSSISSLRYIRQRNFLKAADLFTNLIHTSWDSVKHKYDKITIFFIIFQLITFIFIQVWTAAKTLLKTLVNIRLQKLLFASLHRKIVSLGAGGSIILIDCERSSKETLSHAQGRIRFIFLWNTLMCLTHNCIFSGPLHKIGFGKHYLAANYLLECISFYTISQLS